MTSQNEETKVAKRHRSPNYPYYSLGYCIVLLNKFIEENKGFTEADIRAVCDVKGKIYV